MRANSLYPSNKTSGITPRSIGLLVEFINAAYTNEGQYRTLTSDQLNERVNAANDSFIWQLEQLTRSEKSALLSEPIPLESKTIESVLKDSTQSCFRDHCHYLVRVVLAYKPDNHQIESQELLNRVLKLKDSSGNSVAIPRKQLANEPGSLNNNTNTH